MKTTKKNVESFSTAKLQAKRQSLLAIIALVAMIGFSIAACDNGNGDGPPPPVTPVIEGTFTYNGKSVQFTAQAGITPRSARSVGGASEFTGKIEDGETVFDLSGFYLSSTGAFLLSAGSDSLVYEIAGTSSDGSLSADAKAKTLDSDDWDTFADNTVTSSNSVNITASASSDQLGGLPASWIGRWTNGSNRLDVTPFAILAYGADAVLPLDLLEVTEISPAKFDIVTQGSNEAMIPCDEFVNNQGACGGPWGGCTDCVEFEQWTYSKIRLEQSGSNLILKAQGTIFDLDITNPGALAGARYLNMDDPDIYTRSYSR